MKSTVIALITLLLMSCTLEPESPEESSHYFLSAFLVAEDSISEITVGKMIIFRDEKDSSTIDYRKLTHAEITLFSGDSSFKLIPHMSGEYSHPHTVQPGEKYSITVIIPDTVTGDTTLLQAETTVPRKNSAVLLSRDTLFLADSLKYLTVNSYRDTFPSCEITTPGTDEQYHDITLTPRFTTGTKAPIYSNYELDPRYDLPLYRGNSATIHSDEVHYFTDYEVIIANVTKDHYNLSLGRYDDGEWGALLGQLPVPEISNVRNGGGVFAGVSLDTVTLYVMKK